MELLMLWIPACAGMTTFCECDKVDSYGKYGDSAIPFYLTDNPLLLLDKPTALYMMKGRKYG